MAIHLSQYPVKKIMKRDGRIVDFDSSRIREAIRKAMISVNKYDEKLLDKIVEHVLVLISEKFGEEKIPHVEDVQDIVELSLVKFDQYEVAKAYILYRREREKIRKEKMRILEKDYLDEVDKKFSLNALRLISSRYLLRGMDGKFKEGPKQLFQRVAALIVIPDLLYDTRIYSKEGGLPRHPQEEFNTDLWAEKIGLGKKQNGDYEFKWNKWHLYHMKRLYDDLNEQGMMKVPWSTFFNMLLNGEFENHFKDYLDYYNLMVEKKFMPNSPTLFNAGARLGQLSACFVLPIDDNIESIMKAATEAAIIFKSGGGIGINYSKLRPEGDVVFSTSGVASGPVTFMRIIDTVTEVVKQGGKRRGANMGILEIWHPDIEKFVRAKEKEGMLENFNISVLIEPNFWKHLENNEPYPLINPRNGQQWGSINPSFIFNLIAEMAWKTADPGVLFLDNINRRNVLRKVLGDIRCTNPCGEEPLYEYEPCNLGSINLHAFVKRTDRGGEVDWDELAKAVKIAYRFLDNVIDINSYPLKDIERMAKLTRRIGLGIMGLADMLMALRVPYNSEEGFQLMSKIAEFIAWHAYNSSAERAEERGHFPLYWQSTYPEGELPIEGYYKRELWTMNWDELVNKIKKTGIRNAFLLSIAPTGSISMIVDTSTGLEPVFALIYEKHVTVGIFHYIDPEFEKFLHESGLYNEEIIKKVSMNGGSIQELPEFPESARQIFAVAYDIPWWDHIRAQYQVGLWVDAAVSKTINMPHWVSVEDVKNSFLFAYKLGLKGITIYRDASKSAQVLVTPTQKLNRYVSITKNRTLEMMESLGIKISRPAYIPTEEGEAKRPLTKVLITEEHTDKKSTYETCPECNSTNLLWQEGCIRCLDCGWTGCVVS